MVRKTASGKLAEAVAEAACLVAEIIADGSEGRLGERIAHGFVL
jgi:hypothetical protein